VSAGNLGLVALNRGDNERAEAYLGESLEIAREVGDEAKVAVALHNLADVALRRGDYERCRALVEESLGLARAHGFEFLVPLSYQLLGYEACARDDCARARGLFREALAINQAQGCVEGIAYVLEGFACIATLENAAERALRLAGAGVAVRRAINSTLPPPEHESLDRALEPARRALGEDRAERALAAGSAMTIDEAVALALTTTSA
jgi:tetratricopeptide (TPR) repeat protein